MKRNISALASALFLSFTISFYGISQQKHAGGHETQHWSYKGETGPLHWADLNPEYAGCGTGKFQTPIDINKTYKTNLSKLNFSYTEQSLSVINNGHTVQINFNPGNTVIIDGEKYTLLQFHFHTPGEHTVNGKHFPMEMHFVHKDSKGELGVVGLFFVEGKKNLELQKIIDNLPEEINETKSVSSVKINPANFLPYKMDYYHYSGSLTTPPCTEGVSWIMLKYPVEASAEQINALKKIMGENARPVMPLNKRFVLESAQ